MLLLGEKKMSVILKPFKPKFDFIEKYLQRLTALNFTMSKRLDALSEIVQDNIKKLNEIEKMLRGRLYD